MKHFKSRVAAQEAIAAGADPKHLTAVLDLIRSLEEGFAEFGGWEPEEHGWAVLLEKPEDLDDHDGLQLGEGLLDAPIEGVERLAELGVYTVVVILNNDFGLGFVVPEAILTPAQRAALDDQVQHPWHSCPTTPAS